MDDSLIIEHNIESRMFSVDLQHFPINNLSGAPNHTHQFVEILYGIEGDYIVTVNGIKKSLTHGEVVLVASNQVHEILPKKEMKGTYLVIKFQPEMIYNGLTNENGIKYMSPFLDDKNFISIEADDEFISIAENLIKESIDCEYAYEIALQSDVYKVILWFLRKVNMEFNIETKNKALEYIMPALKYIDKNFSEKITVKQLAEISYLDYSFFSRSFKKAMNIDCCKYIKNLRLQKSEQYLLTTKMNITEIAMAVGFDSTSYYIKLFKQNKGMTPVEFREQYGV